MVKVWGIGVLSLILLLAALLPASVGAQAGADAARGSVRSEFVPGRAARLRSPDSRVTLDVPAGALAETATFSHVDVEPTNLGSVRIARAFRLTATAADGRAITRFQSPLTISVAYSETDIQSLGIVASALRVYYHDETRAAWVELPSTVDTTARLVVATTDHFTHLGAGGEPGGPTPTPVPPGASDAFERPDDPIFLGSDDAGRHWITDGTIWGICGGAACVASPETDTYARIDTQTTSQTATATILPRAGGIGYAGIAMAITWDWNTNLLWIGLTSGGDVEVWTLTGGGTWSTTAIATASTGLAADVTRTLQAVLTGSTLSVTVDGTPAITSLTVPTPPSGATYAAIFAGTYDPDSAKWPRFASFTVVPS